MGPTAWVLTIKGVFRAASAVVEKVERKRQKQQVQREEMERQWDEAGRRARSHMQPE